MYKVVITLKLAILLTGLLEGQESFRLQVVNLAGHPLENVQIHNLDYSFNTFTGRDGFAEIYAAEKDDTMCFANTGFWIKKVPLSDLIAGKSRRVVIIPMQQDLEEVVIIGRTAVDQRNVPYLTRQINEREIIASQSPTSADILSDLGGLFVQKSQLGGGSPIIRGFEANRVLLAVDGVRLNNAIYRSGHLQNAITIDPAALEGVEIILGPGSLLYGSSALGGVVHFKTKEPVLSKMGKNVYGLNAYLRTSTASREKTAHLNLNLGGEKLGILSALSFSDFGDLHAGRNCPDEYPDFGKRLYYVESGPDGDEVIRNDKPHIQVGTSYNQFDLLQKIKFQPSLHFKQYVNFQYSRSSDIPRYDLLTEAGESADDLEWAEWNYGPQRRFLMSTVSQWTEMTDLFDKGVFVAAFQKIDEDRINRKRDSDRRYKQLEDVYVFSLEADLEKSWSFSGWDLQWSYGLDSYWDWLGSRAFSENISNPGLKRMELTRYPDDKSTMYSFGVYNHWNFIITERLNTLFGVRYSLVQSELSYNRSGLVDWPERYFTGIKNLNEAFTWGLSANYLLGKDFLIRTQFGSAFRAPNIDDLAKIRIKQGFATAPNPDLKPEKTINAEIHLTKQFENAYGKVSQISLTGYYTHLKDAVVQSLFYLPNGDTVLFHDNDWYRIVSNVNAENGDIWGVSGEATVSVLSEWTAHFSIHYTEGKSRSGMSTQPMAHIPPLYGLFRLGYKADRFDLSAIMRFNGKKPAKDFAPASSDNLEYATPEGSLAWATLNLKVGYQVSSQIELLFGIENLTDIQYRPFSSGISQPGRNFVLSCHGRFSR